MGERTLCPVPTRSGRDCDRPVAPDSPVPICPRHLREAYLYVRDLIAAADPESLSVEDEKAEAVKLPKPPETADPADCVVYYIRFGDRIKIGTTRNVWKRVRAIPVDRILATEPGSYELERERHEQFGEFRHGNTEWFRDCPEIRQHINALRREYGDPVDIRWPQSGATLENLPWER